MQKITQRIAIIHYNHTDSVCKKKYKYLTRFTTITPTMLTKGNDFRTTHVKTYISGQFILLAEQSDRKFLLTPQDAAGMVKEVKKYWTKPTMIITASSQNTRG